MKKHFENIWLLATFGYKHYKLITRLLFLLTTIRRLERFRHSWIGKKMMKVVTS